MISVTLMKADGTYVGSASRSWFQVPFINYDQKLEAGAYIVVVDPQFNESAELEEGYKDINIDVYTTQSVNLTPLDPQNGVKHLAQMLRKEAQKVDEDKFDHYLSGNADYSDVIRLKSGDLTDAPYIAIYTKNKSQHALSEALGFSKLDNIDVLFPKEVSENEDLALDIPAGDDNIIVLRGGNGYSYSYYMQTMQRAVDNSEIIAAAKADPNASALIPGLTYNLGKFKGNYYVYSKNDAGHDFQFTFYFTLSNLKIDGEPDGATSKTFKITNGTDNLIILKPIDPSAGTSISMNLSAAYA